MKKVSKNFCLLFIYCCFCLQNTFAQVIPFTSEQWEFNTSTKTIEDFQGKPSLYLQGVAYLKDVAFQNGIIEFDINLIERRAFAGVIFRIREGGNYEEIYLRPHQSGKPDAMQYTPVINGMSGWQLYHDQGKPGSTNLNDWKMESVGGFNTPYVFPFEQWMHFKLVVAGTEAELYLNDEKEPILHINELKHGLTTGSIGIQSGTSPMRFANFSYTKTDNITLMKTAPKPAALAPNLITKWMISDAFGEKELENLTELTATFLKNRKWEVLNAERSGLANISTLRAQTNENNTVLAKIEINSTKDQLKKLDLGYSDRARVYCNGVILYSGNNNNQVQDYRHLGTIGFYNSIYLPLKKGKNEIMIAVSENFGGWGVQGKLEDKNDITIQ
ncbi:MAG: DUF1080 domain-containing protein [Saprospiraceae bacterium]|nr:DUF1080 domain-containing protein [Saprospiraceae bacterium]